MIASATNRLSEGVVNVLRYVIEHVAIATDGESRASFILQQLKILHNMFYCQGDIVRGKILKYRVKYHSLV